MARRSASRKVELIADTRSAADRMLAVAQLTLQVGRTRPGWAGERTEAIKWQIIGACEPPPWEF